MDTLELHLLSIIYKFNITRYTSVLFFYNGLVNIPPNCMRIKFAFPSSGTVFRPVQDFCGSLFNHFYRDFFVYDFQFFHINLVDLAHNQNCHIMLATIDCKQTVKQRGRLHSQPEMSPGFASEPDEMA